MRAVWDEDLRGGALVSDLDRLPDLLAFLVSVVMDVDPGALALATLAAGLAWRLARRLRIDGRYCWVLTRWMMTRPVAIVLGPVALALDLALLVPGILAGIRWRGARAIPLRTGHAERDLAPQLAGGVGSRVAMVTDLDVLGARFDVIQKRLDRQERDSVWSYDAQVFALSPAGEPSAQTDGAEAKAEAPKAPAMVTNLDALGARFDAFGAAMVTDLGALGARLDVIQKRLDRLETCGTAPSPSRLHLIYPPPTSDEENERARVELEHTYSVFHDPRCPRRDSVVSPDAQVFTRPTAGEPARTEGAEVKAEAKTAVEALDRFIASRRDARDSPRSTASGGG